MKRINTNLNVELYSEVSHERLKKTKLRPKRQDSKKDFKRNKRVKHIDFEEESS